MSAQATALLKQQVENDCYIVALSGALTMANVGALFKEMREPSKGETVIIETKDVTEADSSSLALLTAIMRRAKKNGAQVRLSPLPNVLASIIEIYGLQDILSAYHA
jgi:anti-anti-sigma factor